MKLRHALAIARAEWLLNRRDVRSLVVIFGLPVLLLILYGYGLNFDLENIPLAVQDLDRTEMSREIIRRAAAAGTFQLVAGVTRNADIARLVRSREALMVLVIPPRFTAQVAAGRQAALQIVLDGSDPTTAGTALGYAQGLVARLAGEAVADRARKMGASRVSLAGIQVQTEVLYNPGLKSAAFIIPGLMGVVMALMAGLLTSTCIVREREIGTMEALLGTSVRPAEIIVGKLLPYAILSLIDIVLCVVAGALIFRVLPRGDLLHLLAFSTVFILACLSVGLIISGLAGSQRTAIVGGIMTLMLPTIVLSGFIFPIANMPLVLRGIANILPATHYLVGMRAIYLRGVSVFVFWPNVLALAGETVVIFWLAVKSFRARL